MKLEHFLTPHTHIKWIRDINVRPIAVKLPEENVGGKLLGIVSSGQSFVWI